MPINVAPSNISISVPQQSLPYCITDEIRDFSRLYPDITFSITVSDALADVTSGTVDIVFRAEENPKPSLWGKRIAILGHSYYAHRSLIEAWGPPTRLLTEVKGLPLVIHEGATGSSQDEMRDLFPHGTPVANSSSLEATTALIRSGVGVGRLPHMIAGALPDLRLVAQSRVSTRRSLWVLTHKDLRSIHRIEKFITFVEERMKTKQALFSLSDLTPPDTDAAKTDN